ncbi:MAG: ATP-binding protein [Lachnospiraceae bacterium]|nr:ATP-binding protein [Lachnospiraceae bacterium]
MSILGREKEQDVLSGCLKSMRPELLVVFGRRRVGKTFLIREYFNEHFSFYTTGIPDEKTRNQLKAFHESLISFGDQTNTIPRDWFEAFRRLRGILEGKTVRRDYSSGKRVVFLDEVPWMDTARSDFKPAFDFFWNSWGSAQKDLLLIICGSATSWIINNILNDKGGFHNRITRQIQLAPFNLRECKAFFEHNGIRLSRDNMIESYMIFGGIPYYLNLFDKRLSLAQNVDSLIFDDRGDLHHEYERLFRSLFKRPENHIKIIETMAGIKKGLQRTDLVKMSGVPDGEGLTKALRELEQCGFIRHFQNLTTRHNNTFYQVIDPFVLFSLSFLRDGKTKTWQAFLKSPGYYAWRGNAFEMVCLAHIPQIKSALGISGIESTEYSWRSKQKDGGTQIDLLIDRRDDVINLCEMKCTDKAFEITKEYRNDIINKVDTFLREAHPDKSVHVTLITSNGLKENRYTDVVQNNILPESLFQ